MTVPTLYQWPKAELIYPDKPNKSYAAKRLRYRLRSLLHWQTIKKFEAFVNQTPVLISLLTQRPNYSYPLVHRFLDKRFNTQKRLSTICDNFLFVPQKLSNLSPSILETPISFGEIIPDFELLFMLSNHQPMEGFWTLELRYKPTDAEVYLLTFGKLEEALLIAVVQGPNFEGAKEMVKQLTKTCHGLRPAYLMVEIMKSLTKILGYDKLYGIPQKYQNKSRFVQSKHFVVDYDAIFSEAGGERKNYWMLPLIRDTNLDDIPSKKRSMYRKRYAMLDEIETTLKNKLQM